MTTTVYVATSGEYSDYGICGIFSTQELANAYVEEHSKVSPWRSDKANIEKWEMDEKAGLQCRALCRCRMDLRTGTVFFQDEDKELSSQGQRGKVDRYGIHSNEPYVVATSYESSEHALKLAVEDRQAYLREIAEVYKAAGILWRKE